MLASFKSSTVWVYLILFAITFSATSTAKPKLKDYAALSKVSRVRISPDGSMIGYVNHAEDTDQIVVVSLKENKVVGGARLDDLKPRDIFFISDTQLIFVASKLRRVLGIRGEFNLSTGYVLNIKSGKIRQLLIPGDVIYSGQSGLGNIIGLTKDHKYALMPAYVGKTDGISSSSYSLVKASLTKRRHPKIVERGRPSTIDYFADEDGKVLAEELFNNQRNLHRIFSKLSGKKTEIYRNETEIRNISPVGLSQDQRSLVIESNDKDTDRKVLRLMSLKDGKLSAPIFSRSDADIESIVYEGVTRIVKGVRYSGFTPSYEFFDKKLQTRVSEIVAKFPGQSVVLSDWTHNLESFVFRVSGPSYSGVYFISSGGKPIRYLASQRPSIVQKDINQVIEFNYAASDGLNIPALLTIPNKYANSLKNLPTVILPHGGPESYDSIRFDWLAQAIASQGYLVVQPQFRGSAGFGNSHIVAGYGEWNGKMQTDLTDGLSMLVGEGITDPKRTCIVGWSYGGYAALAGATFTPKIYKCAISINGVSDLKLMMNRERKEHGRNHWVFSYWRNQITGNTEGDDAILKAASPAEFADKVSIPILIMHGKKDKVVNIEQSELMTENLKEFNKDVETRYFEGEGHSLTGSKTRLEVLRSVTEFLDRNLGN